MDNIIQQKRQIQQNILKNQHTHTPNIYIYIAELQSAVKLPSYRPHAQEDLYDKCKSCGAAKKMLLDRRISLENRTNLLNHIHEDNKIC